MAKETNKTKAQLVEEISLLENKIKELESKNSQSQILKNLLKDISDKQMILDSLSERIIFEDSNNTILWANKAACEQMNKKREDLIGQKCYKHSMKQPEPCPDCPVAKAVKTGKPQDKTMQTPDGSLWEILNIPGGGSSVPASADSVRHKMHYIKMRGNETFKIAVRMLEDIALKTLEENNLKPSDLSLLIPHQANQRIIQATAERLNLPMDKVVMNLERYGNTSAASVPIALDEAVMSGRLKEGDIVLLEAFGGGLTWGSALIKW